MESVRETQKKYCSRAIAAAIICGLIFIVLEMSPIGKGLILGTLFSIINFILIGEFMPQRIDATRGKATWLSLGSLAFRYALLALPLFLAIRLSQLDLFATAVGLFMVQMMILWDYLLSYIRTALQK